MRRLMFALLMLLLSAVVQAQTPTFKLAWNQTEAPAVVAGFQYTLKVDAGTASSLTATCVAAGTGSSCTAPLAALPSGPHTLTLTAFNGFGSSSGSISGQPPSTPTTITVTVTVTIP